MANEFICSDCKGDGTRCRCHEKRGPRVYLDPILDREQILANAEMEYRNALRELKEFNRLNR
mgnify:CR=1 FL=1